jgi:hypothetical protein
MNYYLIDFENVGADGIKDFNGITEGDAFIIFYSENRKNITIDIMEHISSMKLQFKSFKVDVGTKNALDFQLSSYLGYVIGSDPSSNFYIVSNDKGYDCLCSYWSHMGTYVSRISMNSVNNATVNNATVNNAASEEQPAVATPKSQPSQAKKVTKKSKIEKVNLVTLDELNVYLTPEDEPETVLDIFNSYKTKQAICNGLAKKFKDTKRASAVYKKLKPLIKEKQKT